MSQVNFDERRVIDLDLWETHCLLVCLNSTLEHTHNPGICPTDHRARMLVLKKKLQENLPEELKE